MMFQVESSWAFLEGRLPRSSCFYIGLSRNVFALRISFRSFQAIRKAYVLTIVGLAPVVTLLLSSVNSMEGDLLGTTSRSTFVLPPPSSLRRFALRLPSTSIKRFSCSTLPFISILSLSSFPRASSGLDKSVCNGIDVVRR